MAARPVQNTREGETPLMTAAMKGHAYIVKSLLDKPDIDIDARTADGVTALNFACRAGHLEVVKLLGAAGASVNPQALNEWVSLVSAASGGNLQVVTYLVEEAGADVRRAGPDGKTSLMVALEKGRVRIVEYLLGRPDINIDAMTPEGRGALDFACRSGNLKMVKRLVGAGARVNPQDSNEWGPLVSAAWGGHLQVVKYLVGKAGANVLWVDPDGRTALMCAADEGHVDIVEYLRPVISQREYEEGLLAAEERAAAAAAAALLEEEERKAAAKAARKSQRKQKKEGKQGTIPPPEQAPASPLEEPSETPDDTQTMTASLSPLDLGGEATAVERERQAGSSASGMASVAPEPADDGVDRSRPTLGLSVGPLFGRMWDLWHVIRAARMVDHGHEAFGDEEEGKIESMVVVADELSCPICFKLMTDPVMAEDGHTYERQAIEQWIDKCITEGRPVTSPLTGVEMGSSLKPNFLVRSLVGRMA